ncbi:hypothetical protein Pla22_02140 [Rubripirellula amarantea]|uniref:Uncharacterized protein n=1 Tax=Rubripirellula amarantea TaxID=2527999 RepID=A0A5C5WQ76_9BACT|nr:hypothetical protein [Rubripirellula amarantea]TWT52590.1 hypothetical protein Pla22_02140 [Rubripirellula amarantea]
MTHLSSDHLWMRESIRAVARNFMMRDLTLHVVSLTKITATERKLKNMVVLCQRSEVMPKVAPTGVVYALER